MADWADEMAKYDIWRSTEDIAAALRRVRADALEEAAKMAESDVVENCDCGDCSADRATAQSIRWLKDKEPNNG